MPHFSSFSACRPLFADAMMNLLGVVFVEAILAFNYVINILKQKYRLTKRTYWMTRWYLEQTAMMRVGEVRRFEVGEAQHRR